MDEFRGDELEGLKIGLLRRADLLAVAEPKKVTRAIWTSGAVVAWIVVGLVSATATGHWDVAAISGFALAVGAAQLVISLRARHRVPDTKRWIREQGERQAIHRP